MSATAKLQKDLHRSKEILTGCSAIIVGYSETHCERFVTEAGQSLFEHAKAVRDNNEQRQFDETSQYLENRSAELANYFEEAIKRCFDEVYTGQNLLKNQTLESTDKTEELTLVGESEVEVDVAISGMAHRIDARCTQALYGLTQRMAMLNSGIKIDEDSAPYSARFLTQTFFQFIEKADLELSIQLLLLKLFERSFVNRLPNLYRELNNYLVTSNVLPNLRYGKGTAGNNRRRSDDPLLAASESRQEELYQTLESLFSTNTQPINPARPMMSIEQALSELVSSGQDSQDFFSQPAQDSFPNTNSLSLQRALDCVAMLFELVNEEHSIGTPVKNLLSHLRNPYARIALSDPSFLADPRHQARQLMHSLVSAVEQWTDEDTDPTHELVQHVKSIVERVVSEASHQQPDANNFETLLDEFKQYMDTFERKIRRTEQRNIEAAEGREKLQQNQNIVDALIKAKTNNQELPKPVAGLLVDTWASYMTYILLRHGENSDQWEAAAAAVDSVLWYIEPKTSQAEIDEARNMESALHGVLSAGMEQVGLTPAEIKGRLKGLELCQQLATENVSSTIRHSQSAQKAAIPDAAITAAYPSNAETAEPKDQPETRESIQQQQKETVANVAHSSNGNPTLQSNLEGSVVIENDIADPAQPQTKPKSRIQRQQEAMAKPGSAENSDSDAPQQTPVSDAEIEAILKLKFGTWLDWQEPGKPKRRLKLTWYNRKSTNCMLSNKAGQEVGIFSASAIASGVANGHIEILGQYSSKPLFERMLEKFSQKSKEN